MNTRYRVTLYNKTANPDNDEPGNVVHHGFDDRTEAVRVFDFWTNKIAGHRAKGQSSDNLVITLEVDFPEL